MFLDLFLNVCSDETSIFNVKLHSLSVASNSCQIYFKEFK